MNALRRWLKRRWKWIAACALAMLLLLAYPAFVLGYTWWHVAHCDLPGGRNGPLDAYRHTLASAVVAHSLGEKSVTWVSHFMEYKDIPSHRMDRHNNHIGAGIGMRVAQFRDIEPTVARQVAKGKAWARDERQTTWMSRGCWRQGNFW